MKYSLLLAPLLISTTGLCDDNTASPFGVTLGDSISNYTVVEKYQQEDSTVVYEIAPPTTTPELSEYLAVATPETGLIYSVLGRGVLDSESLCDAQKTKIDAVLAEKYPEIKPRMSLVPSTTKRFGSVDTFIVETKCRLAVHGSDLKSTVEVTYTHQALFKQANIELLNATSDQPNQDAF